MRHRNLSVGNKIFRLLWNVVWFLLAAWTPALLHNWRRFLVNAFGGSLAKGVFLYPSVKIWDPRNLIMEKGSTLGPHVDCYNVAPIHIEKYATVSQRSFLCTASHDYDLPNVASNYLPLVEAPITLRSYSWIAAEAFVGPGVTISKGSVVLARGVVTRDTEVSGVYGGNPVNLLKQRSSVYSDA